MSQNRHFAIFAVKHEAVPSDENGPNDIFEWAITLGNY